MFIFLYHTVDRKRKHKNIFKKSNCSYTGNLLHRKPKVYEVKMENYYFSAVYFFKIYYFWNQMLDIWLSIPSKKWQGKKNRISHGSPVSSHHFLVTILFYRWNCHSKMTNITHKGTKKGNKSPVTLQPIKMHSAGAAGRIKISPSLYILSSWKKILESSNNPQKNFQPNSPINFLYCPPWPKYIACYPCSLFNKKCPRWRVWTVTRRLRYDTAFENTRIPSRKVVLLI